jgi:hypothetical protein
MTEFVRGISYGERVVLLLKADEILISTRRV